MDKFEKRLLTILIVVVLFLIGSCFLFHKGGDWDGSNEKCNIEIENERDGIFCSDYINVISYNDYKLIETIQKTNEDGSITVELKYNKLTK